MAASLLATYRRAAPAQLERGRAWYNDFRRECARIARETDTPMRRVVATAAITSPDARLSTNVAWTREACRTRGAAKVGRYPNTMHARYFPILTGAVRPQDGVGGRKVTAFYRAILGDADSVVLDRWALRAAGHGRDTCTDRQYDAIAAVYREAAAMVGETPAAFQAIVWIVLRDGATRSDGRPQGLTDLREAA